MRRRIVFGLAAGLFLLAGLDRIALSGANADSEPQAAVFSAALSLTSDDARFGGLSALHVEDGGAGMIAISDRGTHLTARLARDAGGRLVGVRLGAIKPLGRTSAEDASGQRADSEGLALASDGRMFVSFEGVPRIARYAGPGARPVDLPGNPAFVFKDDNLGLEALAIDDTGTLYAVPEAVAGKTIPVYPFQAGKWRAPLSVPRIGAFRPVAADVGPDGRFYLLERRFDALGGFASRLRRFDMGRNGLSGGVTLLQTRTGQHDNLEGLSVWRARDGLRATMISDDNFFSLQVTEIVEYHLPA